MLRVMKALTRLSTPTTIITRTGLTLACGVLRRRRPLGLYTAREISGSTSGGSKGKGKSKGGRGSVVEQKQRRSGGSERGAKGGGVVRATKGGSSGLWMKRHLKDPYVSAAIEAGAPSRAAFKLVEINDKHGVLSAGDRVVDLGAAPGGWSMVAARIVHARGPRNGSTQQRGNRGSGGKGGTPPRLPPPLPEARVEAAERRGRRGGAVVAVDLLDLEMDLPGVEAIRGDFRDQDVESKIFASLAARERPREARNGQQQQEQQQQLQEQKLVSPLRASVTEEGERVGPDDKRADSRRDNRSSIENVDRTTAGNGHPREDGDRYNGSQGEAFLLRGTSASRSLLPRPAQPPTDTMEELFVAAVKAAPSPTTSAAKRDTGPPLLTPVSRGQAGGVPEGNGRNSPLRVPAPSPVPSSPPADPHPPTLHRRRASVVLSDMAPSFSGDRDMDQGRVAALVLDALAVCVGDEAARRREVSAGGTGVPVESPDGEAGGGAQERRGAAGTPDGDAGARGFAGGQGTQEKEAGFGADAGVSRSGSRESGSKAHSDSAPFGSGREELFGSGSGLLARGGTFLGKFFAGRDEREVKEEAERLFEAVKVVKPPASRSGSGEMYLLAKGFFLGGRNK